jgi:murein DD-endopeptidase MepM/ murein hydrolase activator NlpD
VAKKFYTIMIVPHAAAKFRRIRVSRNLLIAAGSLVGVLSIGGLLIPDLLWTTSSLRASLTQSQRENAELRDTNERFDDSITDLRGKLADIETKAAKFALMVGVEDVATPQLAAGGSSFDVQGLAPRASAPILQGEIDTLRDRSGQLESSFQVLDTAFQKQALTLSSTPSIFPVRGLLGNGYGWRRDPFTGIRDFHRGLDIIAPPGTKVVAPADGIVTRVGRAGGFGKSVLLSHGQGIVTRYGHLQATQVKVGQRVKRRESIATVGSTGRSTGAHLHYEVLVHRRHVDPVKYIVEEYKTF